MEQHKLDKNILFIATSIIFFAILQLFQTHFIYQARCFFKPALALVDRALGSCGMDSLCFKCFGFGLFTLFNFQTVKKKVFIALLLILPPLLSLCFYLIYPHIFAYAGLSGILHGLFVFCAIVSLKEKPERNFAFIVLLCILGKIAWEHFFGALQTEQLIGHPVLIQAHLLGVIFGQYFVPS